MQNFTAFQMNNPNAKESMKFVWTDSISSHEESIASSEEALRLIGDLEKATSVGPTMVEFFDPVSGLAFAIGVGRPETVATFQESLRPPYFISLGDPAARGVTSFCYGNEETEYMARNRIPYAVGKEALRIFMTTRKRPDNLVWEQL